MMKRADDIFASRIRTLLASAVLLFAAMSSPQYAAAAQAGPTQPANTEFGLGLSYLSGNTLYHISSYDATGGIESELEFPLRTIMIGLEGGYIEKDAKGQEALRIRAQWFTNIDNGSGKLKDSDWISGTAETSPPPNGLGLPAHPGLDIYSESDISLKANIVDLRASYNYWRSAGFVIGPLGGLLYQNFQFDASNLHQVGYGPYNIPAYTGSVSGLVLTYEVTYTIPYLGIHVEAPAGRSFQATLDLGFSPWATAADKDDHVLRGKRSTSSTLGNAYLAALTAQWDIRNNNFLLIRGQYLKIDTSGTQTQTWYRDEVTSSGTVPAGTTVTGIGDKLTSQQVSASFTFSHRF